MVKKDINWYLNDPTRLLQKIPFTRGCTERRLKDTSKQIVDINQTVLAQLPTNEAKTISQDVYLMEYDPSMHDILFNQSIPTIAVKIGNRIEPIERIVKTSPLQKNIHHLHVLHLTANPMQFTLCGKSDDTTSAIFEEYKKEYVYRNMDSYRNKAVSKQKKVGDVGVLHYFKNGKYKVKILSYDDGYIVIENRDEDNDVIARSVYYKNDNIETIDTYDNKYRYRHTRNLVITDTSNNEWQKQPPIEHKFPYIPLQYQRGYVAWEFGQSSIEMYELIDNIIAVVQKRFGQFALWIKGNIDEEALQSSGEIMIFQDPDPESNGDMKSIEFPDPKGLLNYKNDILKDIQRSCSVTFIDPDMIKMGGDPSGTAIMLTMKNDIALATQTATDWASFNDEFVFLSQVGFDLERVYIDKSLELSYFSQIKIKANMLVWTPEAKSSKILDLTNQKNLGVSMQTLLEKAPDAAPDEMARHRKEVEEQMELERKQAEIGKVVTEQIQVTE